MAIDMLTPQRHFVSFLVMFRVVWHFLTYQFGIILDSLHQKETEFYIRFTLINVHALKTRQIDLAIACLLMYEMWPQFKPGIFNFVYPSFTFLKFLFSAVFGGSSFKHIIIIHM